MTHIFFKIITSNGDEDIVEWNERKGDQMYELAEFCKMEAAKASNELYKIIDSLDLIMYR